MIAAGWILVSYLIGSVPVAYLLARAKGVDIFQVGTGNPGAANMFRVVSRPLGVVVFLADVAKGSTAVVGADVLEDGTLVMVVSGVAAVVGQWLPVFLKFRGGAGLATAAGTTLGMAPLAGIAGLVVAGVGLAIARRPVVAGVLGYTAFFIVGVPLHGILVTLGAIAVAGMVAVRALVTGALEKEQSVRSTYGDRRDADG